MNIYAAKLDAAVPKCVTQLLERVTSFTHWEEGRNGRMECWNDGMMED
jgi:hypothetical protein